MSAERPAARGLEGSACRGTGVLVHLSMGQQERADRCHRDAHGAQQQDDLGQPAAPPKAADDAERVKMRMQRHRDRGTRQILGLSPQ
jgi:hypothetical protein